MENYDRYIEKMFVINSGHISKETAERLNSECHEWNLNFPPVFLKGDFGWFIYVSEDFETEDNDIPKDLFDCMKLAKKAGCCWLCLDRDAEIIKTENN